MSTPRRAVALARALAFARALALAAAAGLATTTLLTAQPVTAYRPAPRPSELPRAGVPDEQACAAPTEQFAIARARALHEEAKALMATRDGWARAAFRFERAAEASPACDPGAIDSWILAARLYGHTGKLEEARLAFLGAAASARGVGRLAVAAHALLDAAVVAVEQSYQEAAVEAVLEADALSRSPRIPPEERLDIRLRIIDLRTTVTLGELP
ncbi:MAG: hypothetical protein ACRELC_12630 [Gemmatimonadota bacterium]